MTLPSQAKKRPESSGVCVANTSNRWPAARCGLNNFSAGTAERNGADSSVAVVPGCKRLTQASGRRRFHSKAKVRSSWFWAALAALIAIPTTQVVIADAANAGRQGGKPTQLPVVESRGNGFGQQDGSKGIDVEGLLKPAAFECLQAFFGPTPAVVQPTSGVDDQAQRSLLLQPAAELLKVAVATEIQSRG